jgi:hypothetical protein
LGELDEKPNHVEISKSRNFEGKGCKAKDSFKKTFGPKKMFNMGCKYLALGACHMCKK